MSLSTPEAATIQPATLEDVTALVDFYRPVYAATYANDRGITAEMFGRPAFRPHVIEYLEGRLGEAGDTLWVARIGGEILGTAGISAPAKAPKSPEAWGFYVATHRQGEGFGSDLWKTAMSDPRVQAADNLHLAVAKDSTRAVSFYERNDFVKVGEQTWDWPSWVEEDVTNDYWLMETRPSQFMLDGERRPISYVETVPVKEGVNCDVYSFDGDSTKDLALVTVAKGSSTPLQLVLDGDQTIESFVRGTGTLNVWSKGGELKSYHSPVEGVSVGVGEKMQWVADGDTELVFSEVCVPPYQDGRFENLTD